MVCNILISSNLTFKNFFGISTPYKIYLSLYHLTKTHVQVTSIEPHIKSLKLPEVNIFLKFHTVVDNCLFTLNSRKGDWKQ